MADANQNQSKKWYNRWWGIIFLLAAVVLVLVVAAFIYDFVYYFESFAKEQTVNAGKNTGLKAASTDDPYLGPVNAPITIVEFSDFQCPFCLQEFPILQKIHSDYPNDVKIIYRDFPNLAIHPYALSAALAANCANEQGKFWDFHNLLFANQDNLSPENTSTLAAGLNLNMNQFQQCVSTQKYMAEIQNDLQEGLSLGVRGTPGIFINENKLPDGVIPYTTLKQAIDLYLTASKANAR